MGNVAKSGMASADFEVVWMQVLILVTLGVASFMATWFAFGKT